MNPSDYTPEWARAELERVGYVKGRPMSKYIAPANLPSVMVALKVLSLKGRKAQITIREGRGSSPPVVVVFNAERPVSATLPGLRRV